MEIFTPEFFSTLAAIVVIDLVLAGDNAIVIALAARNLPAHLRNRAIMWGTIGAIAVRSALTMAVVWLLKIPGLMLAGGAMLVWIAYKLLAGDDSDEHGSGKSVNGFWAAMSTIIVADALMGLDNVLAVAGAAHGSFLLVVLGLLISIPIVIWGSQLVLKLVERFPSILYFGAGVLAWTACKMMIGEPLLREFFADNPAVVTAIYLAVVGGVLSAGFALNHRKVRARIAGHLADFSTLPARARDSKGDAMEKVLIPFDGSQNSLEALRYVLDPRRSARLPEVHVLNVRTPLPRHVGRFINRRLRSEHHLEEAGKAFAPARALLTRAGVPHQLHVELGDKAQTIDRMARHLGVDRIVMGTARKNSLTRVIEDSVTNGVIERARVPVEVIAGKAVSPLERLGVPATLAATVAVLAVALD